MAEVEMPVHRQHQYIPAGGGDQTSHPFWCDLLRFILRLRVPFSNITKTQVIKFLNSGSLIKYL